MNTPKERGILFSGAMVRALLAGKKTQTRRAVKPQPPTDAVPSMARGTPIPGFYEGLRTASAYDDESDWEVNCPYGAPGSLLWVRETWQHVEADAEDGGGKRVIYRASHAEVAGQGWRPSLLMPRWASRITLAVESIRVERAQAISDADVEAEGVDAEAVEALHRGATPKQRRQAFRDEFTVKALTPFGRWRSAWCLINGRASWDANPWVWVVSFRRLP